MFASLKNKIKEETGNEVPPIQPIKHSNRYQRGRLESFNSMTSIEDLSTMEQKDAEINALRIQCNDLETKCSTLSKKFEENDEENERLKKENELLEESVRVGQVQKELIREEQDKIQNIQLEEISKLKSLLLFRDQEAIDRLAILKQNQQQMEMFKNELTRLQHIEPEFEDAKDELERLRHSSQIEKNNLMTNLAAVDEENRHLKSRLQIYDESRIILTTTSTLDEKFQSLLQERKMLEQRLEEAHLHLSDIKSTWSSQNLALETQVSRLSRQVAEETTEKRKALKARDEFYEKLKQLEFEIEKNQNEILQRDNKIKLLSEEIDDLSSTLREIRLESDEEISLYRNKVEQHVQENNEMKIRLADADHRLSDHIESSERVTRALRNQIAALQEQISDLNDNLEKERHEKNTSILKNAEISQSEEILKRELRQEQDETNELLEKIQSLKDELKAKDKNINELHQQINELNSTIANQKDQLVNTDSMTNEINEKNKSIKMLNQRLIDMKKTLQQEINKSGSVVGTVTSVVPSFNHFSNNDSQNIKSQLIFNCSKNGSSTASSGGSGADNLAKTVVMDEVNFKYLKHVILKFLTSREVEARHLIRAVSTLLHLTNEEEKLLHDTLNWKMSWFGSKPDHGTGQKAFSIPPS